MTTVGATNRLGTFEVPRGLALLAIAGVAVAIAVTYALTLRQTLVNGFGDVQVFFRAAWAVWTGYPLYEVVDRHDWHYLYPPTLALLLGPFADPLPGYPKPAWSLTFPVAVTVWFAINLGALVWASAAWSNALARHAAPRLERSWLSAYWALRLLPPLALAGFIGDGLTAGQPAAILVLLIALGLAGLAAERPFAAALSISLAIALKMYPAALLLIPLLRRDFRTLAWAFVLTCAFLFLLPAICVGIDETVAIYRTLWVDRLAGFINGTTFSSVREELTEWSPDVVSVGAMLARSFGARLPDAPDLLPAWSRWAQYLFDLAMIAAISVAAYGRLWRFTGPRPAAGYTVLVAGATLSAALPAMLPFAELQYWGLALPLVALLLVEQWRRAGRATITWSAIVWTALATLAFQWTGSGGPAPIGHIGPTTLVMLVPVAAGLVLLWRQPATAAEAAVHAAPA